MSNGNTQTGSYDINKESSKCAKEIAATYQQYQITECKGKAHKCEETHEDGESEPQVLWVYPN